MKKLLIIAFLAAIAGTTYAQQVPAKPAFAAFTWESSTHDFGKIKQGTPVTHEFKFTNTGKTPLDYYQRAGIMRMYYSQLDKRRSNARWIWFY